MLAGHRPPCRGCLFRTAVAARPPVRREHDRQVGPGTWMKAKVGLSRQSYRQGRRHRSRVDPLPMLVGERASAPCRSRDSEGRSTQEPYSKSLSAPSSRKTSAWLSVTCSYPGLMRHDAISASRSKSKTGLSLSDVPHPGMLIHTAQDGVELRDLVQRAHVEHRGQRRLGEHVVRRAPWATRESPSSSSPMKAPLSPPKAAANQSARGYPSSTGPEFGSVAELDGVRGREPAAPAGQVRRTRRGVWAARTIPPSTPRQDHSEKC